MQKLTKRQLNSLFMIILALLCFAGAIYTFFFWK